MLWVVLVTTVVTILRFTITPTTAAVCFRWVLYCGRYATALGRMANLKSCRQARVKALAELNLQGLVKLKQVVNDDPKKEIMSC